MGRCGNFLPDDFGIGIGQAHEMVARVAASAIVAAPMLVLFVIFQKHIMESIKTSGLE